MAMKQKAFEVGGDAVILGDAISRNSGLVQVAPGVIAAMSSQEQSGIIIRFKDVSCSG